MFDRIQQEIEQEILGTIFNDEKSILRAKEVIKPYMFQYPPHKEIYLGFLEMIESNIKIDLTNFLEFKKPSLGKMKGISYISDVATNVPSLHGFESKLEFLINYYKKRLYIQMAQKIEPSKSIENIEEAIEEAKVNILKCDIKKEIDTSIMYEDYLNWLYEKNRASGISCGFKSLDKALGNFQKQRLITIFARSGVGKSTFGIQIAGNMLDKGAKVLYGSAEMTSKDVINKLAASKLSLSSKDINEDNITEEDKERITEYVAGLFSKNFYISTETNLEKFINEIKLYKIQNSLDVVFVDYINKYIDFSDNDLMTNKLGKISSKLKTLAIEEDICIVLMAQANRTVDRRVGDSAIEKIDAADIQDSARIEQDSDQLIALYRNVKLDDAIYRNKMYRNNEISLNSKQAEKNPNCINAIIMKNRHGERGSCALKWEGIYSRIKDF